MTETIKDKPTLPNIPLFTSKVACGFPSIGEDHIDSRLDLNEHLVKHPAATFFVYATGNSMKDAGILDGDLLIVDRSLGAKHNSIIVAIINGDFTVKYFKIIDQQPYLVAANSEYKPIPIKETTDFEIWGVVTYAIHVCPH